MRKKNVAGLGEYRQEGLKESCWAGGRVGSRLDTLIEYKVGEEMGSMIKGRGVCNGIRKAKISGENARDEGKVMD